MIQKQVREFAGAPIEYTKYKKEIHILEERKKERIQRETLQLKSKVMNPINHIKQNAWFVPQVPNLALCDHNNRLQDFVKERREIIKSNEEKSRMLNFHKWDLIKA